MRMSLCLVALLFVFTLAAPGYPLSTGSSVTYAAAGSGGRAAEAVFSLNSTGTILSIVLSNTGLPANDDSANLTGLFFDAVPTGTNAQVNLRQTSPSLNASAIASVLSTNYFTGATTANADVGMGWAYFTPSFPAGTLTAHQALTAAGLDIGNPPDGNLSVSPGVKLDGADYGILQSYGASPNDSITGQSDKPQPMALGSVTFTFTNLSLTNGLDLSNVVFQWATAFAGNYVPGDPRTPPPPVPEPSFYGLLTAGLGGLFLFARRRRQA